MSKAGCLARLALVWISVPALADVASNVEAMCPDAMREVEELQSGLKTPKLGNATRPALRQNLLLMARQDQEVRAFTTSSGWQFDLGSPPAMLMRAVDAANLRRLKHIVHQDGFPTAKMVGLDGVGAAWLLAVHAASDPDFQGKVLSLTTGHVRRGEVRSDQVALLTDDWLAGRGKPQRYGTNFGMRDGELKPRPMEDEANVDKRRRKVGLGTLANYTCILRAMSGSAATP
ncbi:MAG: DUF6624 domain-containing protein [Pseudomonadota bacterium]